MALRIIGRLLGSPIPPAQHPTDAQPNVNRIAAILAILVDVGAMTPELGELYRVLKVALPPDEFADFMRQAGQ